MKKASSALRHMAAAIGVAEVWLNELTAAVVRAPIPSCTAPIRAEAVPADFVKGAIARAELFGKTNPWVHRYNQIMTSEAVRESWSKSAKPIRITPIIT